MLRLCNATRLLQKAELVFADMRASAGVGAAPPFEAYAIMLRLFAEFKDRAGAAPYLAEMEALGYELRSRSLKLSIPTFFTMSDEDRCANCFAFCLCGHLSCDHSHSMSFCRFHVTLSARPATARIFSAKCRGIPTCRNTRPRSAQSRTPSTLTSNLCSEIHRSPSPPAVFCRVHRTRPRQWRRAILQTRTKMSQWSCPSKAAVHLPFRLRCNRGVIPVHQRLQRTRRRWKKRSANKSLYWLGHGSERSVRSSKPSVRCKSGYQISAISGNTMNNFEIKKTVECLVMNRLGTKQRLF
jgi:hypothetical protein